jgi:hypothetical protein
MKILTASALALALLAGSGVAAAQSATPIPFDAGAGDDRYQADDGFDTDGHYEYARVLRVVPASGNGGAYPAYGQRNCTTRETAGGYYRDDRAYRGYGEYGDGPYGQPRSGSEGGRTMASVLGSVIGAVIGSQVGGGSARYATTAIGSTVGAVAGRQVYDNAQRERNARVTVCDPVPADRPYGTVGGNAYDVTYEYAGRTYTTRTDYDPGERIRVRVEVHAE